jgi:hypothetical protein
MKKGIFTPVVVTLAGLALIHPLTASAKKIEIADAHFTSTDASGCISTEVFVFARSGTSRTSISESETSIQISQVNDCTETWLMGASGSVPSSAIQIDPNLKSASLDTTIAMSDRVSQKQFDVNVNLTWTGIGKIDHTRNNFYFASPGSIVKEEKQFDGMYRQAQASGSISTGAAEFTPQPAVEAEISSVAEPNAP